MSKKKKNVLLSLFCIVVLFFVYYFFITSSTVTVGTVEKKFVQNNKNYIEVTLEIGETKKIRVPEIVWPLIDERKTYFIK
ncbi:hypothetical protein, partial [Paenibacillus sp. 7516]|uniref:hypothetical protein n=1 Tax=Paenibacillus sp. 7516 TaxID=2022549 RepID=UPI001BB0B6FC